MLWSELEELTVTNIYLILFTHQYIVLIYVDFFMFLSIIYIYILYI